MADTLKSPMRYCGQVGYDDVPRLFARYERFLFLPDAVEPFGRTVIEAWAAGCDLVINRNVGALWWLANDQAAIHQAAARFWEAVRVALR